MSEGKTRFCVNCGEELSEELVFCTNCGQKQPEIVAKPVNNAQAANQSQPTANHPIINQPVPSQTQYSQPQPTVNQSFQPPVQQTPPNKKKTGLIVGIIIASVILLSGIGVIAEKVFQEQGYGDDDYDTDTYSSYDYDDDYYCDDTYSYDVDNYVSEASSDSTTQNTKYSTGAVVGNSYVNSWAGIMITLPSDYSNADADTYASMENSATDCGAYFTSDSSIIYILYEKTIYGEEAYLDIVMNILDSKTDVNYETASVYATANIAGYAYSKAECKFTNAYGDFVQSIYVRKIDDRMAVISVLGVSGSANDSLVRSIKSAG